MKRSSKSFKLTVMALFVAIGLVLQYAEGLLIVTTVPGGKLGLCNIVSIINIFMFGGTNALGIAFVRSLLGGLISGGAISTVYSVAGAVFSTIAMSAVKKYMYPKFSMVGISVVGATVHNLTQITVAVLFYKSIYLFSYVPLLMVFATASGCITGIAAQIISKRVLKGELTK